jgi:hypothetical protein
MALHRTVEDRVGESTLHLLRLRDLVRSRSRLSRKPSPDAVKSLPASAATVRVKQRQTTVGRQSVYRTPLRSCFDRGAPLEASTTSWSSVW